MTCSKFWKEAKPDVIEILEESHTSQFLMNLHPEFESVQSALMNREVSPSFDICVQEVLREETWLQSQHAISEEPKAFVPNKSAEAAFLTPKVQCFECKGYGHVARYGKKKHYCKY